MAISVMTWVWNNSRSRHGARLVLLAIADSVRMDGGWAWPSVPELARKSGLRERAVRAAVAELAALGELAVEQSAGPHGCNRYRVVTTPAKNAPPLQNLQGSAETQPEAGSPQVTGQTPAEKAPPAKNAPLQNLHGPPAKFAPGTVKEPKPKDAARSRPAKHGTADELAAAFWERHKAATAQSFIVVRGVVRTAIANGLARDDVARALDRLAREGRAISGGSITTALLQIRNPGSRTSPSPLPPAVSPRDEHRFRR